jgi:hypothetical protein
MFGLTNEGTTDRFTYMSSDDRDNTVGTKGFTYNGKCDRFT